jgi:uncharacterized RDD family membrane protein YckC
MFCSRCGATVQEGNRFCQSCGQEVGVAVAAAIPVAEFPAATPSAAPVGVPVSAPSVAAGAGVVLPLPYAGFWQRFAAYLIDGLILGIPFALTFVVLIFMFGGLGVLMRRTPAVDPRDVMAMLAPLLLVFWLALFINMAIQWLYFAGMESSARQATFGKSAVGLRVTDCDARRLSFGHATGRFFAKLVSGLIPFGIGYIMAGFTEKKQALHDLIAGTLVLKS